MGYFQDDKGRKDVSKILGFGAFVAGVLYSGLYVLMAVISDVSTEFTVEYTTEQDF